MWMSAQRLGVIAGQELAERLVQLNAHFTFAPLTRVESEDLNIFRQLSDDFCQFQGVIKLAAITASSDDVKLKDVIHSAASRKPNIQQFRGARGRQLGTAAGLPWIGGIGADSEHQQ